MRGYWVGRLGWDGQGRGVCDEVGSGCVGGWDVEEGVHEEGTGLERGGRPPFVVEVAEDADVLRMGVGGEGGLASSNQRSNGKRFDLKIEHFSGLIPEVMKRPSSGSGSGTGIVERAFLGSPRKERRLVIFFSRRSLEALYSFAL
jgi:hypothetical protein